MKSKIIIITALILFSCVSSKPNLIQYSETQYPPKTADYVPVVIQVGQETAQPYIIIGRIKIIQDPMTTSEKKVIENFKQGCREMGGDGLLNIHKEAVDPSNPFMSVDWAAEVFIWKK